MREEFEDEPENQPVVAPASAAPTVAPSAEPAPAVATASTASMESFSPTCAGQRLGRDEQEQQCDRREAPGRYSE
jgi:hypothetical protein